MRGDGDKQSGEFQTLHSELQESKEEVSELMRALEDLALNYDQKADALQGKINYLPRFLTVSGNPFSVENVRLIKII